MRVFWPAGEKLRLPVGRLLSLFTHHQLFQQQAQNEKHRKNCPCRKRSGEKVRTEVHQAALPQGGNQIPQHPRLSVESPGCVTQRGRHHREGGFQISDHGPNRSGIECEFPRARGPCDAVRSLQVADRAYIRAGKRPVQRPPRGRNIHSQIAVPVLRWARGTSGVWPAGRVIAAGSSPKIVFSITRRAVLGFAESHPVVSWRAVFDRFPRPIVLICSHSGKKGSVCRHFRRVGIFFAFPFSTGTSSVEKPSGRHRCYRVQE